MFRVGGEQDRQKLPVRRQESCVRQREAGRGCK